jgi:hypothetical protein
MSTTIDVSDMRTAKALEVLAGSGQWAKIIRHDGVKFYGVPSQRDPSRRYLVNTSVCDCEDQRRHPELTCKHRLACRLLVAHIRFSRKAA